MNRMKRNGTLLVAIAVTALVVAAGLVMVATRITAPILRHTNAAVTPRQSALAVPTESAQPYIPPTEVQIAALPEAMYSAVIPGLIAYTSSSIPAAATYSYTVATDIPVYSADRVTPVARFAAHNFMLLSSVIVPVRTDGPWTLVMTPARQQLPSKDGGHAPAQTVGWVRTSALIKDHALPQHLVVSVSRQSVSIVNADGSVEQEFPAGVGTPNTPTPTGVIGYLEARYVDPTQGEAVHPIQLTSLHATAEDNPYLGHDGGLIGLHYNLASSGAVSHGCVRLAVPAISAVNALPLGTLIVFVE